MRLAILPVVVATVALAAPAGATCNLSEVCSDIGDSLIGTVIQDGLSPGVQRVRLEWMSDSEQPGALAAYQLSRCDSSTCQPIVNVLPVGSCGSDQAYTYIDQPPAPVRRWSYRLDVLRVDGVVACSARVVPR